MWDAVLEMYWTAHITVKGMRELCCFRRGSMVINRDRRDSLNAQHAIALDSTCRSRFLMEPNPGGVTLSPRAGSPAYRERAIALGWTPGQRVAQSLSTVQGAGQCEGGGSTYSESLCISRPHGRKLYLQVTQRDTKARKLLPCRGLCRCRLLRCNCSRQGATIWL